MLTDERGVEGPLGDRVGDHGAEPHPGLVELGPDQVVREDLEVVQVQRVAEVGVADPASDPLFAADLGGLGHLA